jgi:hypothetical protein
MFWELLLDNAWLVNSDNVMAKISSHPSTEKETNESIIILQYVKVAVTHNSTDKNYFLSRQLSRVMLISRLGVPENSVYFRRISGQGTFLSKRNLQSLTKNQLIWIEGICTDSAFCIIVNTL